MSIQKKEECDNLQEVIDEVDVRNFIRQDLDDMIYILGLPVSISINRSWAVALIKEEVAKL